MVKIFQKNPFFLFALYIIIFWFLYKILNNSLSLYTSNFSEVWLIIKKARRSGDIFNNPFFWNSSLGLITRLAIEIFVTSTILFFVLTIFRLRNRFLLCVAIVTVSHSIFLVQFIFEFLYFKFSLGSLQKINQENFKFLSVSYFLESFSVKFPFFLGYFLQTISFFEILYWLIMALVISRIVKTEYKTGLKVVFSSYVPLLFIWLLVISFLTLINS